MPSLLRDRSFRALTVSQFLGALNDNAFKQFVLLCAALGGFAGWEGSAWAREHGQALGQALFALPFLLFAPVAGLLADRVSKRRVIVSANIGEVLVMLLAGLALSFRSTELLFATVALMGTQSAFFGPSKYGAIPELVAPHQLARANGLIQTSTFLAILGGLVLGGLGADAWLAGTFDPSYAFVATAALGALVSLRLRPLPPAAPASEQALGRWNPLHSTRTGWRVVRADRPLALAVLSGGVFWLIGSALVLVLNAWGAEEALGGGAIARQLAAMALGVATGSALAGKLSGDRIELGLVPLGLIGMSLSLIWAAAGPPAGWNACAALTVVGVGAGLFSVPLRALVQARAPRDRRGSVLGLSEFADFAGIFAASGMFALFELCGWAASTMLLVLSLLLALFALVSMSMTGGAILRGAVRLVVHALCRMRVRRAEALPKSGGALLVANHISYIDAFLVAVASPRPVRFLMHKDFFALPLFGRFARAMGVLPVASGDGSSTTGETLRRAAAAAEAGELVCIFAEGSITRSGALLGFRRGLETIARRAGVPIVPLAIHGPTEQSFDLRRGWSALRDLRMPVRIAFGRPHSKEASAWSVRQSVSELLAELGRDARDEGPSLGERFVRSAKRNARRAAVADASGDWSYRRLLIASLATARAFDRELAGEERVGVCLPPSLGAVVASTGLALTGRSAVQLNYALSNEDLASALDRSGARTVLTSKRFLRALGREVPQPTEGGAVLYLEDLPVKKVDRLVALASACLPSAWLARLVRRRAHALTELCVLFSSGSTSEPKGVLLTHGNIAANVDAFTRMTRTGSDDVVLGVLPMFHGFGLTGTLWMPLLSGARAVYHPNPLDSAGVAALARAEKPTLLLGAPSFFATWLRRFEHDDIASVRLAITGAERLDAALAAAWQERLGGMLFEGYGCTELAPAVTLSLPDYSSSSTQQVGSKERSVGRGLPGIALRVVDPETGDDLGPDEEGLVLVASPGCMLGYLGREDLTAAALRDGWYVTGDIGRLDREGFLTLTDRLARFSKIGGEMVSHGRIEDELRAAFERAFSGHELPELAVTSVQDARRGERVCVLFAAASEPAVSRWWSALAESALPKLFLPRERDFVQVTELPRLATGKLDLRRLRDLAGSIAAA